MTLIGPIIGGISGILLGCLLLTVQNRRQRRQRAAYWLSRVDEVTRRR